MPLSVDHWAVMTAAVNKIKSPNSFIRDFLFSSTRNFEQEHFEIDDIVGSRQTAPFVRKDAEAVMVSGYTSGRQLYGFPNIRMKRPQTASELLFTRRPGTVIFPSAGEQMAQVEIQMAQDLQNLANRLVNTEESLCAQALSDAISYSEEDGDHFSISYGRDGTHAFSADTVWGDSSADPLKDFLAVKRLMNDNPDGRSFPVTDAIMAPDAAEEFLVLSANTNRLDNRRTDAGQMRLQEQFNEAGAIFYGVYYGVRVWEYGRSLDGSALIPAGKVQFVSRGPQSEMVRYYGAIPDMDALEERLIVGERYSKSWMTPDPSVRQILLHSRPMPVLRLPHATVTLTI